MAWDEWEQLKSDATQRMQIDHVAPDPGGGSDPDLRITKGPWTKASGVAGELRTATASGLTDLTTAHDGIRAATEGFTSTTALEAILPTWEKRLTAVRNECGRLDTSLAKTGRDFGEVDASVAGSSRDVPAGDVPDWAR